MSEELDKEAVLERKRESLAPEPPADAPRSGVAQLRVSFPSGARHTRKFDAEATLRRVMDWVDVTVADAEDGGPTNYSVVSRQPARTYTEEDEEKTLRDLDLVGGAALFIVDRDA